MDAISEARVPSPSWPLGRFWVVAARALRTVSSAMPYWLSAVGFISARTPGSELPPTITWPTPGSWESFCCRMLEAASYIWPRPSVSEVRATIMIGASAGLTLR